MNRVVIMYQNHQSDSQRQLGKDALSLYYTSMKSNTCSCEKDYIMAIAIKLLDKNSAVVHERNVDDRSVADVSLIEYEGKLYMYKRSTFGAVFETVIFVEAGEPFKLV